MKKTKEILNVFIILIIIMLSAFAVVQKTTNNRGSIGGIKIFTVITGSMIPVYNIGDILIVKDILPEEIKVDDDIVYKGEKGSYTNKTITHRVVRVEKREDGNYSIITKGVNNRGQDPEINQTQVYGKVIGKVPIINWILRIITNGYILILIPVAILIKKNVKKIINMEKE